MLLTRFPIQPNLQRGAAGTQKRVGKTRGQSNVEMEGFRRSEVTSEGNSKKTTTGGTCPCHFIWKQMIK